MVAADTPEMWSELLVTTAGAMAALAGLIFVAVTLNHEEVLASPSGFRHRRRARWGPCSRWW